LLDVTDVGFTVDPPTDTVAPVANWLPLSVTSTAAPSAWFAGAEVGSIESSFGEEGETGDDGAFVVPALSGDGVTVEELPPVCPLPEGVLSFLVLAWIDGVGGGGALEQAAVTQARVATNRRDRPGVMRTGPTMGMPM
jgi:hypothetical protein